MISLVLIPSSRLTAVEFVAVLRENGVRATVEGQGSATLSSPGSGQSTIVPDVLFASVPSDDLSRVRAHARMCSISISPVVCS